MKIATPCEQTRVFKGKPRSIGLLALALASLLSLPGKAQNTTSKAQDVDSTAAGDQTQVPATTTAPVPSKTTPPPETPSGEVVHPAVATAEQRSSAAWKMLTDALADAKHPQTRTQALAALGMLRTARSEKLIIEAMADANVDVRTAAALAAGQTQDRNLTANLRNLLDDKEPQVTFAAAMTLWKMKDQSGQDILMAVVNGERSAGPTMIHGTARKISKDLHDPAHLARLGAIQGASMFLGPFGYGITAYEYVRQNGGDLARVSAIEQVSQERTEPIHKELLDALGDKDQTVRVAAVKALVEYRDKATSLAIYALFDDTKDPVKLTAAAAYLRTTGTPGPTAPARSRPAKAGRSGFLK